MLIIYRNKQNSTKTGNVSRNIYFANIFRTKMYGDEDAKCQLCKVETETLEHLLLDCTELSNIRNPILRQIQDIFLHHTEYDLCQQSTSVQMQILLDITRISKVLKLKDDQIRQIEYQTRRLLYALHSERYKMLNIPWKLKKRNKKKNGATNIQPPSLLICCANTVTR